MAKDKDGHGSEAHRNFHKPQVEHGSYSKGNEYQSVKLSKLAISEYGEATAKSSFAYGTPKISKEPVSVSVTPEGHHYLLDGYHRVEQARRSGKDEVKAKYVPFNEGIASRLKEDRLKK